MVRKKHEIIFFATSQVRFFFDTWSDGNKRFFSLVLSMDIFSEFDEIFTIVPLQNTFESINKFCKN